MNPVTGVVIRPLPFGGGIRAFWTSPTDVTFDHVKVLRKTTNDISGPTDPAATVIYTGKGCLTAQYLHIALADPKTAPSRIRKVLDTVSVLWATTYYYAVFAMDLAETDVSAAASGQATTTEVSAFEEVDLILEIMDYLKAYLKRQIETGGLQLKAGTTTIPVQDAPPRIDDVNLPCVSVHLDTDAPFGFAIGDAVGNADAEGGPDVTRSGYLSDFTIAITCWTDNPEIRRKLYRSLKAAMFSMRPLLDAVGATNVDVHGTWGEDFENYDVPMYYGVLTLNTQVTTCVREIPVTPIIAEIDVNEPVTI